MFTVEEICEEQERQYNRLMQEDDQYCHPESFKWGFEHGLDYALTKVGWHPASELPTIPKGEVRSVELAVYCEQANTLVLRNAVYYANGKWSELNVKWWSYPPEKEK